MVYKLGNKRIKSQTLTSLVMASVKCWLKTADHLLTAPLRAVIFFLRLCQKGSLSPGCAFLLSEDQKNHAVALRNSAYMSLSREDTWPHLMSGSWEVPSFPQQAHANGQG